MNNEVAIPMNKAIKPIRLLRTDFMGWSVSDWKAVVV
jgi:hypothetical protein